MTADDAIAEVFARRDATALFVTEVQHGLASAHEPVAFAAALERLVTAGEFVVVAKPAPDVHLSDIDLRIVARAVPGAPEAIEHAWRAFLGEFLASHRCS